ncbi:hypothetical protein [Salinarimonas ramus]|uniref:Argininosuccinate lyase n=1 Tax=Salinarimonas ramus TaxID=690164 RepID=A0A917QDR6_9HYPH|nr:hypothetical protein [Salinarimonas ramus]GGK45596.1 hypothetical protein GCM10011322_36000 [Salinarimonas ramus]
MISTLLVSARGRIAAGALALALSAAPAIAQNRVVEIVNNTGVTMMEFYASNVDRSSWEEDILGADVLESGYSVDVDIDDGSGQCLFDFRAVFADGDEVVDNRINVCEISTYTYR